jgi:hypothetical protein
MELLFIDPIVHYNPNEAGGPESYPLLIALENDHLSIIELLLQKEININLKYIFKEYTILYRVIDKVDKNMIQFLS